MNRGNSQYISRYLAGRDPYIEIFTGSVWTGSGYRNLHGMVLGRFRWKRDLFLFGDRVIVLTPVKSRGTIAEGGKHRTSMSTPKGFTRYAG